jgi:hypothetical protein
VTANGNICSTGDAFRPGTHRRRDYR